MSRVSGKKRKQLSHEVVWDDSALLESWDAALQEYQLYHSIHDRGEMVEDALREVEAAEGTTLTNGHQSADNRPVDSGDALLQTDDLEGGGVDDGEVEDGQIGEEASVDREAEGVVEEIATSQQHVQDESLKNLVMAWYYAGYYTGLHNGEKQSVAGSSAADKNGKTITRKVLNRHYLTAPYSQ
ncbi:MAG: hypothetical protein Q9178_007442 [Gyalolechia marmorata]